MILAKAAAGGVSFDPVGARTIGAGVLGLALACGCSTAAKVRAHCRTLADDYDPRAIAFCRELYVATGDPIDGANLAYALTGETEPDLASLQALADAIGDTTDGADAWHQLGTALVMASKHADAMAAYTRALAHRRPDDLRGRTRDSIGIGQAAYATSAFAPAAVHLSTAHELAARLGDPTLTATVTLRMVPFSLALGDLRGARLLLDSIRADVAPDSIYYPELVDNDRLLAIDDEHHEIAARLARKSIQLAPDNRKVVHAATIDLVHAELALGRVAEAADALARDPVIDSPNGIASHAVAAAAVARAQHRFAVAIETVATAIEVALPNWRARLLTERALAELAQGDAAAAERSVRDAIAIIESLRTAMPNDDVRATMLAPRREPYELLFRILAARGDARGALALIQAGTARSYIDGLLAPDPARDLAGLGLPRIAHNPIAAGSIARALRVSPASTPTDVDEVIAALGARTVLSYFVAGDEVWLIAIVAGEPTLHRLSIDRRELAETLARWNGDLDADEPARRLGAALVPGELRLADATRIAVAIDGPMQGIPFAALVVDGKRAIERYILTEVPSAAVLAALVGRPRGDGAPVVIGDPTGNLVHAATEAVAVAETVGTAPLTGARATRAAILAAAGSRLLHVASHAETTGNQPALVLADGLLGAGEILDHAIAPATVVLANCASAAAPNGALGDGWGALASSFLAAGTATVVASKWSIEDVLARGDMEALYRAGIDDASYALAVVQRTAIAAGRPTRSWAGYVVIGLDSQRTSR